MTWPAFDPVQAINQLVSTTSTLVGVFTGGLLSFRLGIRQLRKARALDRRIEWQEALVARVGEYRLMTQVLVDQFEKAAADEDALRTHTLNEVTKRGRDLADQLRRTELYGTAAEREYTTQLSRAQIDIYIASWSHAVGRAQGREHIDKLKERIAQLERAEGDLVLLLRKELAMPVLPARHRNAH